MTTIYVRHDVTTVAEVNALALTDRQQNDAIVLSSTGCTCAWSLPYATRNEGVGRWEYDYDGVGHDYLEDGDEVTVLVPIEAEEERDDEWADYGGANRRRLVTPWEAS